MQHTFLRDAVLLLILLRELLSWLLNSAAKEMHACTLASYVITREGCTAALLTDPVWLTAQCLAWVEKFILGLGFSLGTNFPPLFEKVFEMKSSPLA